MLHRKAKEGDRFVLKRGEEMIFFFLRECKHGSAMVSVQAPNDWTITQGHLDKLNEPDLRLTRPPQPG